MAKNCLVTAGPTWEPIDGVRRLTNLSTGRLGTGLAAALAGAGHRVTLLRGEAATWPERPAGVQFETFSTTDDLARRLAAHQGSDVGAVFHAAAVADFTIAGRFRRTPEKGLVPETSEKPDTRVGALLVELQPAPKLLPRLRDWFPNAFLVGWKYEVEGDQTSAIARGCAQVAECRTNLCVVNGPAWGNGFVLVTGETVEPIPDATELHQNLLTKLATR